MIQALRNTKPDVVERILANIVQEFLPKPFDTEFPLDLKQSPYIEVLRELRKKTNVGENDVSQMATTKLLNLLSQEISNITLRGDRAKKAKERLGQKGELPFKNYTILFANAFEPFEILGTKKSHVLSAFNDVDRVMMGNPQENSVLLFTSKPINDNTDDPFILLVISNMEGTNLMVSAAVRLYYSDITITKNYNLVELLEKFLGVFGFDIRFKKEKVARLFTHEIATNYMLDFIFILPRNKFALYRHYIIAESQINGMHNFYFIFGINLSMYREYLLSHKVRVGVLEMKDKYYN